METLPEMFKRILQLCAARSDGIACGCGAGTMCVGTVIKEVIMLLWK